MSEQQQEEPIWTISFVPVNAAAGAQMIESQANGTVQALTDSLVLKHAAAVERRINRAAKAAKRLRRN